MLGLKSSVRFLAWLSKVISIKCSLCDVWIKRRSAWKAVASTPSVSAAGVDITMSVCGLLGGCGLLWSFGKLVGKKIQRGSARDIQK